MWDGSTVPAIYRLDCTDARLPFAILLFASYALAQDGSLDNLRADLGHTRGSDMLYKHYRAATTAETAAEYWSIRPE